MKFEKRENFIFELIKKIKGVDFVIIGGYAVNAYTLPRFSIDCDFVVKTKSDAKKLQKFFESNGFILRDARATQTYKGSFISLKTENPVKTTIDILVKSVLDRQSGREIPAELIFQYSKNRIIYGKGNPIKVKARVVDPELLFCMKCIAARKADTQDCFMLSSIGLKRDILREVAGKLSIPRNNIESILETVSKKEFIDGLQGVYGKIPEEQRNQTQRLLERNLKIIQP